MEGTLAGGLKKPLNENQECAILAGCGNVGSNLKTYTTIMGANLRLPNLLPRSTHRSLYESPLCPCRRMADWSSRVLAASAYPTVAWSSSCSEVDTRVVVFLIGTCENVAYASVRRAGSAAKPAPPGNAPFVPARHKAAGMGQRTACAQVITFADGIH